MKTQAYFENIQEAIKEEINLAEHTIQVAVAWFTDSELFNLLLQKAQKGFTIELILMDDRINRSSGIDYSQLNNKTCKVWQIKQTNNNQNLMHNKFCIIDNKTIISGSYNWTRKAQQNQESITIVKDDSKLALDFEQEFQNIKNKYFGSYRKEKIIDFKIVCIRLESLKNSILIEDFDDVELQISKIKKLLPSDYNDSKIESVTGIITTIYQQKYSDTICLIDEFVRMFRSITIFIDPEIEAIRLEIRTLEIQISSLEDERSEMEKTIYSFQVQHDKILGELILKILELRKSRLKIEKDENPEKEKDYNEAEEDYNNFKEDYESNINEEINDLTPEQKTELTILFRKASKLCHPDIVADEQKEMAQKVFIELKKAYDTNNLNRLKEIYNDLLKGVFTSLGLEVSEKQKLLSIVIELRSKRAEYESILTDLKSSETFRTIQNIKDLDNYFNQKRIELLEVLQEEELKTVNENR